MRAIVEHFERIRVEFRRYSGGVLTDEDMDREQMFRLAVDGRAGIVSGRLPLRPDAYVSVYERIVLGEDERVQIAEYSYYLVVGAREVRGYDLDPTHRPPAHRHVEGHHLEPWPPVSLREVIEDFWDVLTLE